MKIALFTAKPNQDSLMFGHKMSTDEKRPPNGIGYLYSVLKKDGFDVEIYDRYCGNLDWPSDNFKTYDLVGIYCATVCTNDIQEIINKVESKAVAVGGPHVSLFTEWFDNKVNYLVLGEGERVIVGIAEEHRNFIKKTVKTDRLSNEDLDQLPRFPYEYFWANKELYTWKFPFSSTEPIFTLSTSRGCPFACSFCSVKKLWGRKITFMSADRVYDDILYCKSIGAKGIYFREDNFTVNKSRLHELCRRLMNLEIEWACETRVDAIDEETAQLMSLAGCVGFYIGVESLSQHMLDVFNKGVTVEQILKCFELSHKYNIKTAASLITNHPQETESDKRETDRLLHVIKPTMMWKNQYRADG